MDEQWIIEVKVEGLQYPFFYTIHKHQHST